MISAIKPSAAALILLIFLHACSTATPRFDNASARDLDTSDREINVVVATDGSHSQADLARFLAKVSNDFDSQVGIRLNTVRYLPVRWEDRDVPSMLYKLYERTDGCDFDIAIGFAGWTPGEYLLRNLMGTWDGAIDDTYRRFIVVRSMDQPTLLHELAHAFMFRETHSGAGLMAPMTLQLLPFVPIKLTGHHLGDAERREIIANKWRDFSQVADLASRQHPITILEANKTSCG